MNQYEERIIEEICKSYETKESKPKFSDEEIAKMNTLVDGKDLFSDEEKEKIKKLSALSLEQDFNLARLFSRCYDCFLIIKDFLFDEENDFRSKVGEYLKWYEEKTDVDSLRNFVQRIEMTDGGIGTEFYRSQLNAKVMMHRKDYLDFVAIFTKIVGVED